MEAEPAGVAVPAVPERLPPAHARQRTLLGTCNIRTAGRFVTSEGRSASSCRTVQRRISRIATPQHSVTGSARLLGRYFLSVHAAERAELDAPPPRNCSLARSGQEAPFAGCHLPARSGCAAGSRPMMNPPMLGSIRQSVPNARAVARIFTLPSAQAARLMAVATR